MADAMSQLSSLVPSKATMVGGLSKFMTYSIWFFLFLIVVVIIGVIVFFLIQYFKFNKKIEVYKKINGRWERIGTDRAMEYKYGMAGDTVFYLRKHKKYLPRPELQTGRNTYWFGIREDGEWINIELEDIDLNMRKAKVHFLHADVRYARTQIQRNLRERHEDKSFIQKYAPYIVPIATIAICGLILWFIADKVLQSQETANAAITQVTKVLEQTDRILANVELIKNGAGARPLS